MANIRNEAETQQKDVTGDTLGGHDWDDGDLTRPVQNEDGTWTDGTITYTCKNDPTHTKTETVAF